MRWSDRVLVWLAYRLPRRMVYWAVLRVAAQATTGPWADTEVPGLTVMEALRRWEA